MKPVTLFVWSTFTVHERILTLLPVTVNGRKVHIICVSATDHIWQCLNSHVLLSRSYFCHKLTPTSFHPVCISPHITPFYSTQKTIQPSSFTFYSFIFERSLRSNTFTIISSQYKAKKRRQIWILDPIRDRSSLAVDWGWCFR